MKKIKNLKEIKNGDWLLWNINEKGFIDIGKIYRNSKGFGEDFWRFKDGEILTKQETLFVEEEGDLDRTPLFDCYRLTDKELKKWKKKIVLYEL